MTKDCFLIFHNIYGLLMLVGEYGDTQDTHQFVELESQLELVLDYNQSQSFSCRLGSRIFLVGQRNQQEQLP